METYDIQISARAAEDMLSIMQYIIDKLQAPDAAQGLTQRLRKEINSLAQLPRRYAIVPDARFIAKGYRKLPVDNYIILYTIDEEKKAVNIVTVQYGRRAWDRLI